MESLSQENQEQRKTPLKAIREKCIGCSGDSAHEAKLCPISRCPLYPFRFGKNPFVRRINLTAEQRKAIGERLKAGRNADKRK